MTEANRLPPLGSRPDHRPVMSDPILCRMRASDCQDSMRNLGRSTKHANESPPGPRHDGAAPTFGTDRAWEEGFVGPGARRGALSRCDFYVASRALPTKPRS